MEEIKIGEYVRDKDGIIILVKNIVPDEDSEDIWYEEKMLQGTWKSMIVKHSSNLIDLIEEGDYVNGEVVWSTTDEKGIETVSGYYAEKDIKSIVTHEQFKSIEYRVETEEKK